MTKDMNIDPSLELVIECPNNAINKVEALQDIIYPLKPEKQENSLPENINKICVDGYSRANSSLTEGILNLYAKDCQKIQSSLKELVQSQSIVLETVQQENSRFIEMKSQFSLDEIFSRSRQYHAKLVQIKKDMLLLTEKASKLKRRALRLQEQKQREALQKEQSRERELEKEKQILAKVVTKP